MEAWDESKPNPGSPAGLGHRRGKAHYLKAKLSRNQNRFLEDPRDNVRKQPRPTSTAQGLCIRVKGEAWPDLAAPTLWRLESSGSDCWDIRGQALLVTEACRGQQRLKHGKDLMNSWQKP